MRRALASSAVLIVMLVLSALEFVDLGAGWLGSGTAMAVTLVAGFLLGAWLNPRLNSSTTARGGQGSNAGLGIGVLLGIAASSVVPQGGALGALLAGTGGFLAALAYFSPKLRDHGWLAHDH